MTPEPLKYRMKYDYHTHTTYSHGKGSIEDNVREACRKGLRGIAISDHGPGHLLYGIDRKKIPEMRGEIERLKTAFVGMEIFFSVEANIINSGSGLDLTETERKDYDFVIAGYHYGVRNGYCAENFMYSHNPARLLAGKKLANKNTDMAVKAIYGNPIRIFTHPGDKAPVDIFEIAKACAENGTYFEINDSHRHLNADELRIAAGTDVEFVVSSDAHSPERVGSCAAAIGKALEAGIDIGRIVNIEEC